VIKFFKMLNGEEIVAEVGDDTEEWCERLEMHYPYRNLLTQQGVMLVAYPCDHITVSVNHVLFTGEANEELSAAYRQLTGGIITPPRGIQLSN